MSRYEFRVFVAAPAERVFDLWTDLDRMREWVGGVTKVTDVSGPVKVISASPIIAAGMYSGVCCAENTLCTNTTSALLMNCRTPMPSVNGTTRRSHGRHSIRSPDATSR